MLSDDMLRFVFVILLRPEYAGVSSGVKKSTPAGVLFGHLCLRRPLRGRPSRPSKLKSCAEISKSNSHGIGQKLWYAQNQHNSLDQFQLKKKH